MSQGDNKNITDKIWVSNSNDILLFTYLRIANFLHTVSTANQIFFFKKTIYVTFCQVHFCTLNK